MLGMFDYLFTDRRGVRILNRMGYDHAEFFPMWGHDPEFSRVMPGVEKTWDIGMIGNLNAQVQRERAPWLARVAQMADRYKVRIAGGVYGDNYTRMLNATKITFNRSIRGEMNMRCYEAAACGSVLFYEEENEEIRDFFQDRVHCVLYNEQNLEELLEYYLEHDEEREKIVAAAKKRVAQISHPLNLNLLAARLEDMDLEALRKNRRIASVSIPEISKRQVRQVLGWEALGSDEAAVAHARRALKDLPHDPDLNNDYAVANAQTAGPVQDAHRRRSITQDTINRLRRAIELEPRSAFYKLNLAHVYAEIDQVAAAIDLAQQALEQLGADQPEPADPLALPFPYRWEEYRIQYSTIYNATRWAPEAFESHRRLLLMHRAGMLLGRLAWSQRMRELAELGYAIAAQARPDLGSGHVALGNLLADRGALIEAGAHLEVGLQNDPFLTEGWASYARVLLALGRETEARDFIRNRLTITTAVAPPNERWSMTGTILELDSARKELQAILADLDRAQEGDEEPVDALAVA
jgi:tetratricopeptide (TPR) repeat protein